MVLDAVLCILTMSPIYAAPARPRPPETTNAPVLVPVLVEVFCITCTPPWYKLPPIPTPPVTVNAPVLVDVELVLLLTDML